MATKKKAATKKSRRGRLNIGSDPPVLVGGGGSSLVWVKFDQGQTPVNPNSVPPTTPAPTTKADYSCSKITNAPVRLYFNNGLTPGPAGEQQLNIPAGGRYTWYIRFAAPGSAPRQRRKRAKK